MKKTILRKPVAAALGLGMLLLASGIDPHPVWCHKPDGRVDVEAENAAGECRCDACLAESGLEGHRPCVHEPGALRLRPLSCRHEKMPADTAVAPPREPRGPRAASFVAGGWGGQGSEDTPPTSAGLSPHAQRLHKPPPLVGRVLRC